MTSRPRRACYWVFTENDEPDVFVDALHQDGLPEGVRYLCGQMERAPDTGRRHFQGYLQLIKPQALSWVRTVVSSTAHFEVRMGTHEQAREYCRKEESSCGEFVEMGVAFTKGQGARSDLLAVKEALDNGATDDDIAKEFFGQWCRYNRSFTLYQKIRTPKPQRGTIENIVYFGPPGTGKSTSARARFAEMGIYEKSSQNHWFDGYNGEPVILWDDFNTPIKWDLLMRYMDKFAVAAEIKGGFVHLNHSVNVFTTNTNPLNWYKYPKSIAALTRRISKPMGWVILTKPNEDPEDIENWNEVGTSFPETFLDFRPSRV